MQSDKSTTHRSARRAATLATLATALTIAACSGPAASIRASDDVRAHAEEVTHAEVVMQHSLVQLSAALPPMDASAEPEREGAAHNGETADVSAAGSEPVSVTRTTSADVGSAPGAKDVTYDESGASKGKAPSPRAPRSAAEAAEHGGTPSFGGAPSTGKGDGTTPSPLAPTAPAETASPLGR